MKLKILPQTYIKAFQKFSNDRGFMLASALTFYTMFAIVPLLAVAIEIASRFGLKNFLITQLYNDFPGQEQAIDRIATYAQDLIQNTKGGLVAVIGIVILTFSIFRMLHHVEKTFNDIWHAKAKRKILKRLWHYILLVLLVPIVFITANGLQLFISKQLLTYNVMLSMGSTLVSFTILLFLFTWIYKNVPYAKVKYSAALFGGVHTAIAYMLLQALAVKSQLIFSSYGAVYGSLSALPIFLIWLQYSWQIVLFGAQLSYSNQRGYIR